jgi:hypothetical protein
MVAPAVQGVDLFSRRGEQWTSASPLVRLHLRRAVAIVGQQAAEGGVFIKR